MGALPPGCRRPLAAHAERATLRALQSGRFAPHPWAALVAQPVGAPVPGLALALRASHIKADDVRRAREMDRVVRVNDCALRSRCVLTARCRRIPDRRGALRGPVRIDAVVPGQHRERARRACWAEDVGCAAPHLRRGGGALRAIVPCGALAAALWFSLAGAPAPAPGGA